MQILDSSERLRLHTLWNDLLWPMPGKVEYTHEQVMQFEKYIYEEGYLVRISAEEYFLEAATSEVIRDGIFVICTMLLLYGFVRFGGDGFFPQLRFIWWPLFFLGWIGFLYSSFCLFFECYHVWKGREIMRRYKSFCKMVRQLKHKFVDA